MAGDNTISSLDRAIDIMEYIHQNGGECALSSIAQGLGLYKSLVHRVLQTLKARDFVYQNEQSGRYGLGTRLFVLGKSVEQSMGVSQLIRPLAKRLSEKYNECVHVTIPYSAAAELPKQLLIDKVMSMGTVLTVSPPVGAVTYCHASASGKCMMAFAKSGWVQSFKGCELKPFTPNTIVSWDALERQLDGIRQCGYATEDGETENGLSCTAVPILTKDGEIYAVLSISGPTSRIRSLDENAVVADLKDAAAQVCRAIW